MADSASSIFNESATQKLRSPDDLEKYVRVTSPSVWVIVFACVTLLLGLLAWGLFGTVSTNISVTGAVIDNRATCLLSASDISKVYLGDDANVGGVRMKVSNISLVPLSREEARAETGSDYLVGALMTEDWGYQLEFEGDVSSIAPNVPIPISITTERMAPIRLILGNGV